jgi:hypothetical protein
MTSPVPLRLRFGRGAYKWALITGVALFAGMAASLVWNVLWPVWADPEASEEKWRTAIGITANVLIIGGIAAFGIAVIGWIVRFALTREVSLWPGRKP